MKKLQDVLEQADAAQLEALQAVVSALAVVHTGKPDTMVHGFRALYASREDLREPVCFLEMAEAAQVLATATLYARHLEFVESEDEVDLAVAVLAAIRAVFALGL